MTLTKAEIVEATVASEEAISAEVEVSDDPALVEDATLCDEPVVAIAIAVAVAVEDEDRVCSESEPLELNELEEDGDSSDAERPVPDTTSALITSDVVV